MPYIEDYLRRKVDPILQSVYNIDEVTTKLLNGQSKLIVELAKLTDDEFCGTLNYVCTQLIRHMLNKAIAESIIVAILNDKFLFFPKYRKLKDCQGLLSCMFLEFNRREWDDFGIISRVTDYADGIYCRHEKKKQEVNGDLK